MICVYFLKNKSDAVAATKHVLADVAPYGTVNYLRSDNGTEYMLLCDENHIKYKLSAPYSPPP